MTTTIPQTAITVTNEDVSTDENYDNEIANINNNNNNNNNEEANKGFLRIKEIHPQLKREVTRHKFPGNTGIDVIVMPATPRASPVHGLKPKIIRKPQDLDVTLGEDAEFEVVVEDPTSVSVSWSKDNTPLFGSGRMQIGNKDDIFFFKISKTELDDEALYECRVRNDYGEVLLDVQLLVDEEEDEEEDDNSEKPPKIIKKLRRVYTTHEGDTLILKVVSEIDTECISPLKCSWYYQGQKLLSSSDITIENVNNTHTLCIQEVLFDDEGCYKCLLQNDFGQDECETDVFVEE